MTPTRTLRLLTLPVRTTTIVVHGEHERRQLSSFDIASEIRLYLPNYQCQALSDFKFGKIVHFPFRKTSINYILYILTISRYIMNIQNNIENRQKMASRKPLSKSQKKIFTKNKYFDLLFFRNTFYKGWRCVLSKNYFQKIIFRHFFFLLKYFCSKSELLIEVIFFPFFQPIVAIFIDKIWAF